MYEFTDQYGVKVKLSFGKASPSLAAAHVLVFCRYGQSWLLTDHPKRGLECPGGKAETGETMEEAAVREVYEETGAVIEELHYLGEYCVEHQEKPFVKAVFFAQIGYIEKKSDYMETNGPVLLQGNLLTERMAEEFSFLMKDEVVARTLSLLEEKKWV